MNERLLHTWLFGAGADTAVHAAMAASGADVLIQDLEDFTPPARRAEARALDAALAARERALGLPVGRIGILPVCETALGVVNLREIAAASPRIRFALLGAEDLAADLMAERSREAVELDHARRRFVLECRAAGIEPVDAPYTFSDAEGAALEARYARRLGYRCKSLVRPDHVAALRGALVPGDEERAAARRMVLAFEAARERGEERALVDGLWVEVPTYLNAKRLLAGNG